MANSVVLVTGDDASLVAQRAKSVVDQAVGDGEAGLIVEEFGGPGRVDYEVAAVVDAITTPSLLGDPRVIVVREVGRLAAADLTTLVKVAADSTAPCTLVLIAGGGSIAPSVTTAVKAVGEVVSTTVANAAQRKSWLAEGFRDAPVKLAPNAIAKIGQHLGEDLSRLANLLESLAAAYGVGASVGLDEVLPYLGEAGGVPPWDLTDAIDSGEIQGALSALDRMMSGSGRAAPEVVAILHRHYANMLRLDQEVTMTIPQAQAAMATKSEFVAKKCLAQSRRLGSRRLAEAIGWVADADLDTKGRTGLAPTLVLEILVARLARQARAANRR